MKSHLVLALLLIGCPRSEPATQPNLPLLEGQVVLDRPLDQATDWHRSVHATILTCLAMQAPSFTVAWSAEMSEAQQAQRRSQEEQFYAWLTTPCAPAEDLAAMSRVPTDTPADLSFFLLHAHALSAHQLNTLHDLGISPTVHGCDGDVAGMYGDALTQALALTTRCAELAHTAPAAQQESLSRCASASTELQRHLDGAESIVCEVLVDPEL